MRQASDRLARHSSSTQSNTNTAVSWENTNTHSHTGGGGFGGAGGALPYGGNTGNLHLMRANTGGSLRAAGGALSGAGSKAAAAVLTSPLVVAGRAGSAAGSVQVRRRGGPRGACIAVEGGWCCCYRRQGDGKVPTIQGFVPAPGKTPDIAPLATNCRHSRPAAALLLHAVAMLVVSGTLTGPHVPYDPYTPGSSGW